MADVVNHSENHQDLLIVGELRSSCLHKAKHVAEVHITIVNTVFKLNSFFAASAGADAKGSDH